MLAGDLFPGAETGPAHGADDAGDSSAGGAHPRPRADDGGRRCTRRFPTWWPTPRRSPNLARTQVQHADRVVGEAIERLRLQLVHTDQILTGALETVEEAGATVRRAVLGPVQSITAIVRGIQTGLEFFRGTRSDRRRRERDEAPATAETQDESLFI